jgi:histidinol-phosphatase (PHP family)
MSLYVDAAIEQGMTHFGVSDHGPAYWLWGDHAKPGTQMAVSELPHYVTEARQLQSAYSEQIHLSVGVEADFIEGRERELERLLTDNPFDYVLGSVHYCGAELVSIFQRSRWDGERAEETYADYYRLVTLAAQSGLFDILSHLTAVEAYAPPESRPLACSFYPAVADAVAQSGCVVEVNTSGYRKMGGDEPFPNRTMLRLLRERGVPLTFSSDCHHPDEVGFGRDRVRALLHELGIDTSNPQPVTVRRNKILAFV